MDRIRHYLTLLLVIQIPPSIALWFKVHPLIRFWRKLGAAWTCDVVGGICLAMVGGLAWVSGPLLATEYGTRYPLMLAALVTLVAAGWARRVLQKR